MIITQKKILSKKNSSLISMKNNSKIKMSAVRLGGMITRAPFRDNCGVNFVLCLVQSQIIPLVLSARNRGQKTSLSKKEESIPSKV